MTNVYHPNEPGFIREFSLGPREAVIAAYAQSRKDWNTWDYERSYGHRVMRIQDRMGIRWTLGGFWAQEPGPPVDRDGEKVRATRLLEETWRGTKALAGAMGTPRWSETHPAYFDTLIGMLQKAKEHYILATGRIPVDLNRVGAYVQVLPPGPAEEPQEPPGAQLDSDWGLHGIACYTVGCSDPECYWGTGKHLELG